MTATSREDLQAAHRGMVTSLENVLFDLGEVGRAKVRELTDAHWEIITELQDKLEEADPDDPAPGWSEQYQEGWARVVSAAVRDNLEPGRHAHPVDQAEAVLWAADLQARARSLVERQTELLSQGPDLTVRGLALWMTDAWMLLREVARCP